MGSKTIPDFFRPNASENNTNGDYVANFIENRIIDEVSKQNKVQATDVSVSFDIENYKNKVSALEKQVSSLTKDNKNLKYLLNKSNQINLQKDLLIIQLKNTISENEKNKSELHIPNRNQVRAEILFQNFENEISQNDLLSLRSINDKKEKDSTFVLKSLKIIYKDNLSVLSQKCATTTTSTKQQLTPYKKKVLNDLFIERLSSMNLSVHEEVERKSKFRQLLSNALNNINTANKNREKNLKKVNLDNKAN